MLLTAVDAYASDIIYTGPLFISRFLYNNDFEVKFISKM